MDTKVYLLDGGTMEIDGLNLFWIQGPAGNIRFPVYSVLIEHKEGRFLYDTGVDANLVNAMFGDGNALQTERQSIPGQLDLVGLRPSDITHVMNSHYHLDHVGGNRFCTCATTLCHKAEMEAVTNPHPIEKLGYSDTTFLCEGVTPDGRATEIYTPKFELISGDAKVAKGVTLFETPGHTPGHYSLLIELANRRPMIFSGDACYSRHSLDSMAIATAHSDAKQAYASLERLKAMAAEHDAELFFSHDRDSWEDYVKAPGFYS